MGSGGRFLLAIHCLGALLAVAAPLSLPVAAEAASAPSLGTTWASEVSPEAAVANAFVNPEGLSTSWHFEYLTDAAYAANLAGGREGFAGATVAPGPGEAAAIASLQVVSWPLSGLSQSTTYHLRAVVESAGGAAVSLAPPLFFTGTNAIPCEGDACQPLPSAPEDPSPGTQVPTLGNPKVKFPKPRHRHRRHRHRGHRR
jgi:hypothetical protein